MEIEYKLPFRRGRRQRVFMTQPVGETNRAPRPARMLALAHKLEALVRSGAVRDYSELAPLGHVSPSRVSQILLLLYLAPSIQEEILFAAPAQAHAFTESELRKIAREPRWDRQRFVFEQLVVHAK